MRDVLDRRLAFKRMNSKTGVTVEMRDDSPTQPVAQVGLSHFSCSCRSFRSQQSSQSAVESVAESESAAKSAVESAVKSAVESAAESAVESTAESAA